MNGIAALIARFFKACPILLDWDDYEAGNLKSDQAWQRRIVTFFEDRLPFKANGITTHNSFLLNRITSLGIPAERIFLLPNGADNDKFSAVDEEKLKELVHRYGLEGKKVIGFIGSLSAPSHPLDLLLDAFRHVHPTIPDTRLIIVGGGDDYQRVQDHVERSGLGNATVLTGRIDYEDIPHYYQMLDVLVDPVEDNPVGKSRLPLKMFESWAADIPFVSADVGDRRQYMGNPPAGVLVEPGNPEALAEGILNVLTDGTLAEQLRSAGIRQAEKYSWEKIAANLERICLEISGQPTRETAGGQG